MQNHYFDNTHPLRPYTHSLVAMPGTIAPINALRGEKPSVKQGLWPGEKNGKWIELEDHREKEGFLHGKAYTIKDIGPYPEGWSIDAPELSEEEKKRLRLMEIDVRLGAIDLESIRPLRAIAEGKGSTIDAEKLATLESKAEKLRNEREELHTS